MSEPDLQIPSSDDPWADCTWEGSELATLRHAARLTFAEKLKWLEDMHEISLMFQAARRKMGLKTIFPDGHIED
jgi:hypothetical protein